MAFPLLDAVLANAKDPRRILVWVKCPVTFELMRLAGYTGSFQVRILNRRWAPLQALALRLHQVELLLAPQACGDWRMPLMAWLTGAKIRVGRENPLGNWGFNRVLPHYDRQRLHKTRFYLQVAAAAGYAVGNNPSLRRLEPSIELRMHWRRELRLRPGDILVAVAPGSSAGETHKRWPTGHFAEFIARALARHPDWKCVLFGGAEERELLERIKAAIGAAIADRAFIVTEKVLERALAVLAESACVVTNCNGPAHMAALVGAPLVSIYGPTNAGNTAPFTSGIRVLSREYACSPCYRHEFLRGCGNPVCMTEITPDAVLNEVQISLSGQHGNWPVWRDTKAAVMPVREGFVARYVGTN